MNAGLLHDQYRTGRPGKEMFKIIFRQKLVGLTCFWSRINNQTPKNKLSTQKVGVVRALIFFLTGRPMECLMYDPQCNTYTYIPEC